MATNEASSGSHPADHGGTQVQPDFGPPPPQPENPEVKHEHSDVNVRAILWSGAFIIVLAAITHAVVWYMFLGFQEREKARNNEILPMFREENEKRTPARLLDIPPPRLEGFEPSATLLVVRTKSEDVRLDLDQDAEIEFGEPPNLQTGKKGYDLREGMEVSVVYRQEVGHNVVLTVNVPPAPKPRGVSTDPISGQRRDVNEWVQGTIVRLDPKSIGERRVWLEERLKHYGPVPNDDKAARIPLADAMALILKSEELKKRYLPAARGQDPAGPRNVRLMPTQTNSGHGRTGEAR